MGKFKIQNSKFKMGIGFVFVVALISLGFYQPTKAATVTTGPLQITFAGDQLFSETNMYPGMPAIVKSVSIKNTGVYPHSFSIAANGVSGALANVLQIEPRDSGVAIWNQTLSQLSSLPNGSKVIVPSIASGATKNIQIAAILPANSGNSIQGQSTLNFGFTLGDESTDQAEPSGLTSRPNNSLGGRVLNAITYNPPVSGDQSQNSVSTTTPSGTTTDQVAGASTVAGTTTVAKELCFWWLVALIILIIFLVLYHRYNKKTGKLVVWWLWPVLFAGVLYGAHFYVDKNYQQTIFCHWFWAIEIVTLIIYLVIELRTKED